MNASSADRARLYKIAQQKSGETVEMRVALVFFGS
jgi:hypothetical protein